MRKRTILILVLIFISLTNTWSSQTVEKTLVKDSIQNEIIKNNNTKLNESDTYRLLYNNTKEANNRIAATIQWVIGISVAFLLAILGGQIFFNWRINKREIDFIKKDIDEKIYNLKLDLLKDINESKNESEKELKEIINEKFKNKSKELEMEMKLDKKELDNQRDKMSNELKELRADIQMNTGDIWLLKGVKSNALSNFLETAKLKIDLGYELKYILDDISDLLKGLDEIHLSDYQKLNDLVSKLNGT